MKNESAATATGSDVLSLFEKLEVDGHEQSSKKAAVAQLSSYLSNRSVALLLRPEDGLWLGSGVCIRIDHRYFVATAKHNLQHNDVILPASELEVRARGEKYGEALKVVRMSLAAGADLAWLELDEEATKRPSLVFVTIDEIAPLPERDGPEPCFLLGYPSDLVEKPAQSDRRPLLESVTVGTLSIPSARSQRTGETFGIEWPPRDGSLDDDLPQPYGMSGGGVWFLPRHGEYRVWAPERARLAGIETAWRGESKELVAVRIERWLDFVASELPELRSEIGTHS